ncbi:MAG TPA: SDR family oxidoreductase [Salinimicrobium sp.]|nr:SDR family oxidoreductase [Salinimicrobium sp.]
MEQEMENVLIVGANGKTGREIVDILHVKDHFRPIAMVRNEEQAKYFIDLGVETVLADLEEVDMEPALKNIDRIIFAAGSGSETGKEKTLSVDRDGAIQLMDAAVKREIKKFVMLSSMGTENPSDESDLYVYLRAKHEADEHLKASGLNYTIVRPGKLSDKAATGNIRISKKQLDTMGEISRHDVAQVLTYSLHDHLLPNKTVEIIEGPKAIRPALEALSE